MMKILKERYQVKIFDIIQVGGIPFVVKRIYIINNPGLFYKKRFVAHSYVTHKEIDAAVGLVRN